jgi:hypothetical protein
MTRTLTNADIGDLIIAGAPVSEAVGDQAAATAVPELTIAGVRTEIIFIEDNVPDIDALVLGFGAGKEVVVLDSTQDGLQQIVGALEGRTGVDALHILSHGAAGSLNLGALTLNATNLNTHQGALQAIGNAMSADGDILLYGCDIGAGQGKDLIGELAIATGADIAASDDLTGAETSEGDWALEVRAGQVEADVVVDTALAEHYQHVLALANQTVTFNNDANFVSKPSSYDGPNGDVIYRVGGNDAYRLVIDAKSGPAAVESWQAYAAVAYGPNPEENVALSFQGGQVFSLSSMKVQSSTGQTLQLRGLDANSNIIANTSVIVSDNPGFSTVSLNGFSAIKKLVITTNDNGGYLQFFALDDLVFSDIHTAVVAPRVISVSSSNANAAYKAGDAITLAVSFDQAVTVDTSGGTPALQLETGGTDRLASYMGGSGSNTLTFVYTIMAGDATADLGYLGTAALSLNGGAIRLADGTDAVLTLPVPGSAGSLSANKAIVIDTVAPSAPQLPVLATGSDTGLSSSDRITSTNTPTLTGAPGSVESGATVRVYDTDGVTQVGTTTAAGDGSWLAVTSALSDGTHTLTAKAVDAAGNTSTASGGVTLTIDRTAPTTEVMSVSLSPDTGVSGDDWVTSSAQVTVSGNLSAALGSDERVEVSLDNGATFSVATMAPGDTSWSLTATLAGSNTLLARLVDVAGNIGTVFTKSYVLDTVAPSAPSVPDLDAASDTGSSASDNVTGDTTPTFSGTAEVGATVRLYDGATEIGTAVAAAGTWSITSAALDSGSHNITAVATDKAGNTGPASAALEVSVITDAPSTRITAVAISSDTGSSTSDLVTRTATQTVSGTLDAALSAGERVEVSVDGGQHWAVASSTSTAWSLSATLASGTNLLSARVVNAVDNSGPLFERAYTLDVAAPAVAITAGSSQLKLGQTTTITFTFSEDPGATFTWNGSAGDVTVSGGTLSAISGTGTTRFATFTPDADTNDGHASITVNAGGYADLAGNVGLAGVTPVLTFDTQAPATPSTPVLAIGADTGISVTDRLTSNSQPTFTGTAEAGAQVTLYDTGGNAIGSGIAVGGTWSISPAAALGQGVHTVTAIASDAYGNASAASAGLAVTVDMNAPTVVISSNVDTLKVGETAVVTFTFSEDPGATFTIADVAVAGGSLGAVSGSGLTRTAVFTPMAATDFGMASVTVAAGSYTDAAGNAGGAGASPQLTFDTLAPPAPTGPALAAASDTGALGDGRTTNSKPVLEGTASPGATVVVYDGLAQIGTATTDGLGKWTLSSAMGIGSHSLTVVEMDAVGNKSVPSPAFMVVIESPASPPSPPDTLVDGVLVQVGQVLLPGGVQGNSMSVSIVTTSRNETSGDAGVADIPLASGAGANLLLAKLAPGYGLSTSGANVSVATGLELLLASIKAATPTHVPADQGHLTGNGQSFLSGLAATGSLLVQTVRPVSDAAPDGVLTLSGDAALAGQHVALVIETDGLAKGSVIELQHVDFAAVVGAAEVVARSGTVSGDAASQHFTVAAGSASSVFAGGGIDTLSFGTTGTPVTQPGTPSNISTLHGGSASDVAIFTGPRSDFDLEFHNGYVIVTSKAVPEAKAMLVNVEQLQFGDTSIAVERDVGLDILAGMYESVLGRQADLYGFEYWGDLHSAGASWGSIALSMIDSDERKSAHDSFTGDTAHDVGLLYQALFNRAADDAGLAYWQAAIGNGMSLEQVAASFVASVEMTGHQRAASEWDFQL